jgi:hypothetical protein
MLRGRMPVRVALGRVVGAGLLASISACVDIPSVATSPPDAGSPIAFVQAQTSNAGSSSTATVSLGNAIAAHDAIVLCMVYDSTSISPAPTPVKDTLGNTYSLVVGPAVGDGTVYVAVASDSPPGRDTITVTLSGTTNSYFEVYAHEYAGLAQAAPFEDGSFGTGTTSAVDGMASGPVATTGSDSLLFGCGQAPGVAASGTGFTLRTSFDGNVTEDAVVHGAGTQMVSATMASAAPPGFRWTMLGAAFKGQ